MSKRFRKFNRETKETSFIKYAIRTLKRVGIFLIFAFIIYVLVMIIVWAAPKIWYWALG